MEALSVLIYLGEEFTSQVESNLPTGMAWDDITQWWGRRVQWGGVEMYNMIPVLYAGLVNRLEGQLIEY